MTPFRRAIPDAEGDHTHTIHRLSVFIAVVALITLATFLISGQVSPTLAGDQGGLGKKIAGTYLAVQDGAAQALQISEDGNLSIIISFQFSGGVCGFLFSDTLGSWKKTGRREITARIVNLNFRNFESGDVGAFAGVATATYLIKFDKKFQAANVMCEGAIFRPGVNPFEPDAEPILDSEFNCGAGLEFDRVAVDDDAEEEDGDDDKDKDDD